MMKCSADGGCADAAVCIGDAGCDLDSLGVSGGSDKVPAAGSGGQRSRVQAMRVASDAGSDAGQAQAEDAASAQPSKSDQQRGQAGESGATGKPRAGSAAPMMMMMEQAPDPEVPQAGQGDQGQAGEPATGCEEQSCGPCQACADGGSCQTVTGRDDADSCSDTRSCSSKGMCLHVSEAHTELGTMVDWAELSKSYAQVLTFSEPASIAEIRLEASCTENDETFPLAWIVAAPGGIPSESIIASANLVYQPPSDRNTFALLELSQVLEQPDTGPIAIVVGLTDMSCIVRLNKEEPYMGGGLFTQAEGSRLWTPTEGSMVFQVLSSQ